MCCSPDSAALAAAAGPRLDRLRAACADAGMGAFFVRDTSNIAWLTAFDGVFDDEDAHALLVTPSDAVLHTDSRYSEAARAAAAREGAVAVDDARVTHAKFVAETFAARHADRPSVEAEAIALGIEDSMSLAGFRALEAAFAEVPERPKLRETSDFIVNLRAVKDVQEIARMKAAQAVTDAAFAHIVGYMRPGMTEREVQIELEDFMRRHGAEGLAFPSIVAAGANGASPHAIPGQTVLEAGQCVVLDFGARAHGYCSDMTLSLIHILCGTGPTALSILHACAIAGADVAMLVGRDKERSRKVLEGYVERFGLLANATVDLPAAQAHHRSFRTAYERTTFKFGSYTTSTKALAAADLVVNATPLGMNEGDGSPFDVGLLSAGQTVFDAVYGHGETALVRAAREAGCTVHDGAGMLVAQAVATVHAVCDLAEVDVALSDDELFALMAEAAGFDL